MCVFDMFYNNFFYSHAENNKIFETFSSFFLLLWFFVSVPIFW